MSCGPSTCPHPSLPRARRGRRPRRRRPARGHHGAPRGLHARCRCLVPPDPRQRVLRRRRARPRRRRGLRARRRGDRLPGPRLLRRARRHVRRADGPEAPGSAMGAGGLALLVRTDGAPRARAAWAPARADYPYPRGGRRRWDDGGPDRAGPGCHGDRHGQRAKPRLPPRLGAIPVAYGNALVDRVRALAPQGIDIALDAVGGEAIDASLELVPDRKKVATLVDFARTAELALLDLGGDRSAALLADLVAMWSAADCVSTRPNTRCARPPRSTA